MQKKSVKRRLLVSGTMLPIITAILVGIVAVLSLSNVVDISNKKYDQAMYDNYDQAIKSQTQAVFALMQHYYDLEQNGWLTEVQAQQEAMEAVRAIRYGDAGDGYFWIDNIDFTLVMHPILPENEGTNRENLEDQNGNMIIQMIKKTCLSEEGAGFNQFWFTKADGVTVAEKRAYSAYFEPWQWCISTGNYLDDIEASISNSESDMHHSFIQVILFIVGIAIVMGVVSFAGVYYITKRIMKPLRDIRDMAGRMSEGNFSKDMKIRHNNEFGQAMGYLNAGQEHLRKLLQDTKQIMEQVGNIVNHFGEAFRTMNLSVREVADSMTNMSEGVAVQAESAAKVNESISSMGNGIKQTDTQATQLNEHSTHMKNISNEVKQTMDHLEHINTKVKDGMGQVSTQTRATNQSVQQIAGAAQLIQNIAEQTNLLALNASIEAARAGESGKGFAVVATEIGSLATQSSDAVKTISEIIDGLVNNSNQGIETLEDISKITEQQYDELIKTGELFQQLYSSLEKSIQSIGEIAKKTKEIESERASITDSVETLASMAEENAAGTEETKATSDSLLDIIEKMSDELNELDNNVSNLQEHMNQFII